MNIKNFVRLVTLGGVVLLVLFVAMVLLLMRASTQARMVQQAQLRSLALSRETADNSFGLTANVRSYVASGEALFKDAYFNIINVRSGQTPRPIAAAVAPGRSVPLDDLYVEEGFTDEERGNLSEANRLSGELAKLEVEAMTMVEEATPEEINDARLRASAILHGPAYLNSAKAIQAPVGQFERLLSQRLARLDNEATTMTRFSHTVLFALIGVTLIIVAAAVMWMRRRVQGTLGLIATDLGESSHNVSSAANEIRDSAGMLAKSMTDQASMLEETASALEEIASATRQSADQAEETRTTMAGSAVLFKEGADHMEEMTGAMSEISESSEKIGHIVKTIEDIAFQTNLLALNAAVEAARAGEAGKGFAVVADEVRNLAGRSAQAARDTTELIEFTIRSVQHGVDISSRLEKSFSSIGESNNTVGGLVNDIAHVVSEQAQGVDQINAALAEVDKTTQSAAAASENEARAAAGLAGQAETLSQAVEQLLVLVGGVKATARPAAVTARRSGYRMLPAPRD
ncbi:MAG: methyl-accepting chemotaxis protein [Planctomycetaceae bacterium]|nr:methyl-accepting chemotaxis protein [Planctomycetaceae bacterium]